MQPKYLHNYEEKAAIKVIDESLLFTCGIPLFGVMSSLIYSCLAETYLLKSQYYSAKLVTLEDKSRGEGRGGRGMQRQGGKAEVGRMGGERTEGGRAEVGMTGGGR